MLPSHPRTLFLFIAVTVKCFVNTKTGVTAQPSFEIIGYAAASYSETLIILYSPFERRWSQSNSGSLRLGGWGHFRWSSMLAEYIGDITVSRRRCQFTSRLASLEVIPYPMMLAYDLIWIAYISTYSLPFLITGELMWRITLLRLEQASFMDNLDQRPWDMPMLWERP